MSYGNTFAPAPIRKWYDWVLPLPCPSRPSNFVSTHTTQRWLFVMLQDDLACVIQHLRGSGRATAIALWGRSMGAACSVRSHCPRGIG